MKKVIFALICLIVTVRCHAEIITVDNDGPADFDNIQAAINASNNGDTIIVADGNYTGTGNWDIDYLGKAITVKSQSGPENCIIDCNITPDPNGRGGPEPHQGFYFRNSEDANSVLDGFTIKNAYGDYGAGIHCWRSSPTIKNCIIRDNFAAREGGGIYCYESSPAITNCIVRGNYAQVDGGGIYCVSNDWENPAKPMISNCTITGNSAGNPGRSGLGGGIYCENSIPIIVDCNITGNTATEDGGGIYFDDSPAYITNSQISSNQAQNGGGLYFYSGSGATIQNCDIVANSAAITAGGIYRGSVAIKQSIIWGNSDSSGINEASNLFEVSPQLIAFCSIQDNDPDDSYIPFNDPDNSNIDDDPLFVREPNDGGDGWGVGDNDDYGDLHLRSGSPCIDAGGPNFYAGPNDTDLDGQPRVMGATVDMGVDEFFVQTIAVTSPSGSETWTSGSAHEIMWTSQVYTGNVNIEFSQNNGGSWSPIAANIANTGAHLWHLPDIVDSDQCIISIVPIIPDSNVVSVPGGLFTISPSSPDLIVSSKWETLGGSSRRSGLSETTGPEVGCVKWSFQTQAPVSAGAAIGPDNKVIIASEDGMVYTLDSNGQQLWAYDINSTILSTPTIGPDGTVYIGSYDGRLYAIDAAGSLRWTHTTGAYIHASPAVSADGSKIFLGSGDGILYALASDGSELWTFETDGIGAGKGSIFASPSIGHDGTVYVAGLYDPNLYALDPNTGSVRWTCNFERTVEYDDPLNGLITIHKKGWPVASPVVAEDGTIYQALIYDTNLYAIDPNTGDINWSTDLAGDVYEMTRDEYFSWYGPGQPTSGVFIRKYKYDFCYSEPVIGPDGTIYVSFDDAWLRAVDPNGSYKWAIELDAMGGFTLTVGSDGLIYAACDNNTMYVVSPDGDVLSRFDSDSWVSFPVIADDNTIIVSDANNTVWALAPDGCEGKPTALHRPEDIDRSGIVNFIDFAMLAADWFDCTDTTFESPCYYRYNMDPYRPYEFEKLYLTGDVDRNRYVDIDDFRRMANNWLNED